MNAFNARPPQELNRKNNFAERFKKIVRLFSPFNLRAFIMALVIFAFLALVAQWITDINPGPAEKTIHAIILSIALVCAVAEYLLTAYLFRLEQSIKNRSREITSSNHALTILIQCYQALVRAKTDRDLLDQVCQVLAQSEIFDLVWAGEMDAPAQEGIAPLVGYDRACQPVLLPELRLQESPKSFSGSMLLATLADGQPRMVHNIETNLVFRAWKGKVNLENRKTCLILPIIRNGTLNGIVALHTPGPERFSPALMLILRQLTMDLSNGLEGLRVRRELQETRTSLEHESDRFSRLAEMSPVGILAINLNGEIIFGNQKLADMVGILSEKLIGVNIYSMGGWQLTSEDGSVSPDPGELVLGMLSEGKPFYNRYFGLELKNGQRSWLITSGVPLLDRRGNADGFIFTLQDLSELRQKERALGESERRYQQLFESVQEGIWVINSSARTTYANRKLADMLGYSIDEVIGKSVYEFFPAAQQKLARTMMNNWKTGLAELEDVELLHRDGRVLYAHINLSSLMEENGEVAGAMALVTDITARRQREKELEAIARITNALRDVTTRQEVCRAILEQMAGLFQGRGSALALRALDLQAATVDYAWGMWSGWVGCEDLALEEASLRVMDTHRPFVAGIGDDLSLTHRIGDRTVAIGLPLITQGESIGTLWIGRTIENIDQRIVSQEDIRLLRAAADIAASSLYRATLFEKTQLQLRRANALREINLTLIDNLDTHHFLDQLLAHITGELGVDAADILLHDPVSHQLSYAAGRGLVPLPGHSSTINFRADLAGQAVQSGQVISISCQPEIRQGFERSWEKSLRGMQHYEAFPLVTKGQVKGVLELFYRNSPRTDPEWMDFVTGIATQVATMFENAELFERLHIANLELTQAYDATIEGWSHAMELRDREMEGHAERVVELTLRLAEAANVAQENMIHIRRGAFLHDIGKMAIPDTILFKEDSLNPQEWEIMRMHPIYAYQLLYPIGYLRPAVEIPFCHHERWDGRGYPRGLKGTEIPLAARIFSIVDVWDALRSNRIYRKAWTDEQVRAYIEEQSGSIFDPDLVRLFFDRVVEIPQYLPGLLEMAPVEARLPSRRQRKRKSAPA